MTASERLDRRLTLRFIRDVKVYSMPAIGRRNVPASADVGRRRISPMEETAECPSAAGGFAAMGIDWPGCSVVSGAARPGGMPAGCGRRSEAVPSCNRDDEADGRDAWRSDTRKGPAVGRVAAAPAFDRQIGEPYCSCLIPVHWRCADRGAAREHVDDDHRCAAVPADEDGPGLDVGVVG